MSRRSRIDASRAYPPAWSPNYAVRRPLAAWLELEAQGAAARFGGAGRLLDVGCGALPYAPLFAGRLAEYVGLDFVENPLAQLQGAAEALPVADASFDLVLCTQVLEHCDDPARVVAELRRVTRPGGRVLASTHGVQPYHPSPVDHWRWTHSGLEALFRANADWSSLSVEPGAGTAVCLAMLGGRYLDLVAKQLRLRPLARPLLAAINRGAFALERSNPRLLQLGPGSLIANYHVTAEA